MARALLCGARPSSPCRARCGGVGRRRGSRLRVRHRPRPSPTAGRRGPWTASASRLAGGAGPGPGSIRGTFRPSVFISKNTSGSQGAEAILFWAGFHGGDATPCAKLLSPAAGGSSADLAAAVAKAPGTKVVHGPTRVTVGRTPRAARRAYRSQGCWLRPGIATWRPRGPHGDCGGECWAESSVGDTIRVWIVDVGESGCS